MIIRLCVLKAPSTRASADISTVTWLTVGQYVNTYGWPEYQPIYIHWYVNWHLVVVSPDISQYIDWVLVDNVGHIQHSAATLPTLTGFSTITLVTELYSLYSLFSCFSCLLYWFMASFKFLVIFLTNYRIIGLCVLKAPTVGCQLIPVIDMPCQQSANNLTFRRRATECRSLPVVITRLMLIDVSIAT